MPKKRTRKTREENMEIIKETTLEYLKNSSYLDLSINKVAELSEINISQIYRYFPKGKPDILIAIGNDIVQKGAPDPELPKYKDPRKLLLDLLRFYIRTHRDSKKILASLQTVFLSYPELMAQDARNIDAGASNFNVLKTCIKRFGIKEEKKLNETARIIFHLIDTMIHRHVLEVKIIPTDEEFAELLSNITEAYVTIN